VRPGAVPTMHSMIPSVLRGVNSRDSERIKAIVRKAYPSVRQLSVQKGRGQTPAPTLGEVKEASAHG